MAVTIAASSIATTAQTNANTTNDYAINFDADATISRTDRHLDGVSLNGSADGYQSLTWGMMSPTPAYYTMLDKCFTAKAGETLSAIFSFTGNWMNGYVYLDRGNDGTFDATLNDDYTIPSTSDIMQYAYVETVNGSSGYTSDGSAVSGDDRNVLNPPAFTIPADLAEGYYRLRLKVDWGDIDPAGSESLINNGGMIFDTRINIHDDVCRISTAGSNGNVVDENGTPLDGTDVQFGKALTVKMVPSEGYSYEGIIVRHGYNLHGDSLVHGTPQYIDTCYPAYLFDGDKITIPASMMTADVEITGLFVENTGGDTPVSDGDYPLNFDKSLEVTHPSRKLNGFELTCTQGGTSTITIDESAANLVYRDMTARQVSAIPGDQVETAIDYTGNSMHGYLYIDLNQDGQFRATLNADGTPSMAGELVAYTYYNGKNSLGQTIDGAPGSVEIGNLPTFEIPTDLPTGVYRARLKIDWNDIDPAGHWSEGGTNQINDNGGYVIDFLINLHDDTHELSVSTMNGSLNGAGNTGLPLNVQCFEPLTVVPTPAADGYVASKMTIRHGHNFDGPQYLHGNKQWGEYSVPASEYTLPADSVNGDIVITVNFEPTADAEYKLIFNDEFDGADGSQPDADKWSRCPRQSSTWNRWLSDSEEVVYIKDGQLVTRAIPNPDQATDPVPMITGGIQSAGKFDFLYGKIEARLLTNPHTGNFPAFWMMPTDQRDGWPNCGEIDIWEQIDNQNTAYHTVHSNWTYNLGNTGNPTSSFNETVAMDRYHTYGFEWDETTLRWFVDGKQVGSYAKSSNTNALDKGQWPFGKAFYIILNQSVGNGSWAANADVTHTYETLFDWVRVYQKDSYSSIGNTATDNTADIAISTTSNSIDIMCATPTKVTVCDIAGRVIFNHTVNNTASINVARGIYIVNGKKVLVH